MEQEHVIHGLLRKRQEIAAALDVAQGQLPQLIQDIDAVDATLRLFQPDIDVGIVRVRPTPRRYAAMRGESSRLILDMRRVAGELMATRDIVLRVMEARGINAANKPMAETMRMRVASSLRGLQERGTLASPEGRGAGVRWALADALARLWPSSGLAKSVSHGALDGWPRFCAGGRSPGHDQTLFLPDVAPHGRRGVAERRTLPRLLSPHTVAGPS